ncbi:CitB Response regulator containing a CheY-like receiver domain and an HTH DNA-binding domain [Candidatus Planktophila vernalis]|uniref:LuxR C-terminal-related transcriptional regulator n=1 Tax=Candidatus Planktophila vernalis TaxID=1884907 RepID=UPI003CEE7BFD
MNERVLVMVDDAFEMSTLVAALRLHDIDVIAEAKSESVGLNLLRRLQPDVILLDMNIAGMSSIKIAINMRKENQNIGIVILNTCPDLRLMGESNEDVPAGTKILIKKSIVDFTVLCNAINDSIPSAVEKHKVTWINGNTSFQDHGVATLMTHLTNTQAEVLRLVASGMTNAQIGRTRYVSEKSVEQVISRVAQELHVHPDANKNMRVQLVGEYYRWLGAPHH